MYEKYINFNTYVSIFELQILYIFYFLIRHFEKQSY